MYTVTETQELQTQARKVWSDDELFAFIDWIAENPLAGDVWVLMVRAKCAGQRKARASVAAHG